MSNIFFEKDLLTVIAARPGMGTTSFVIDRALYWAYWKDKNVLFFSPDNSKEVLLNRMLCNLTGIDKNKFSSGMLNDEEATAIRLASEYLKLSISIYDIPQITVPQIRRRLNRKPLTYDFFNTYK